MTKEFSIEGMSCMHCVMAVRKELEKLEGVQVENVEIGKARVTFESETKNDAIIAAIDEAGYTVTGAA